MRKTLLAALIMLTAVTGWTTGMPEASAQDVSQDGADGRRCVTGTAQNNRCDTDPVVVAPASERPSDARPGNAVPVQIDEELDQEADSGDVDQSFTITGGSDNSNQCSNAQGAANTGNTQDALGAIQTFSDGDDFEFEESGADVTVSPSATIQCTQTINQAAATTSVY